MSARNRAEARGQPPPEEEGDVTRDAFLGGKLVILQPRKGPRTAIDGILLSAAIPISESGNERVLDAGSGTGIVALTLAARAPQVRVIGIERQADLVDLARENAALNGFATQASFVVADLTHKVTALEAAGLARESFDHVTANPPYYTESTARPSASPSRQRAYVTTAGALDAWLRFLAAMARPGGTLTMIHRAEALPDVLKAAEGRFGGLVICPLFPHRGAAAIRVLVQGTKGSRAPLAMAPGLILHDETGAYRREVDSVLKGEATLKIRPDRV